MIDLALYRRFFAEEIAATAGLKTPALIDALAAVPREHFLRPGPWMVRGEGDFGAPPRHTPDADPRHTYHNYSMAIDPARQLFNGAPGLLAMWIDSLGLQPGHRVLHIGAGLGYYSALIGHVVGAKGTVVAIEVDESLASEARTNLLSMPWVDLLHGDGTAALEGTFNAILVNAGVTHPQDAWLDALAAGGRLLLPLTVTMPAMGSLGKGFMALLTKSADGSFSARTLSLVSVYSGVGLRDEALNASLGAAMMRSPFPTFSRLRRDPHDAGPSCWLHGPAFCFS
ncbi:MAG TPA: hypothetical protein VFV95_11560 [Vicinamibacterales bacterium]|nr:hypothetical protein [Vicinamibacterales bacterium]